MHAKIEKKTKYSAKKPRVCFAAAAADKDFHMADTQCDIDMEAHSGGGGEKVAAGDQAEAAGPTRDKRVCSTLVRIQYKTSSSEQSSGALAVRVLEQVSGVEAVCFTLFAANLRKTSSCHTGLIQYGTR